MSTQRKFKEDAYQRFDRRAMDALAQYHPRRFRKYREVARRPMTEAPPAPTDEHEAEARAERDRIAVERLAAAVRAFKLGIRLGMIQRKTCQTIIEEVSLKSGFSPSELIGKYRARDLVAARHEVYYRCRMELSASYPMIGRALGGRDHTTILHGAVTYAQKNGLPIPGKAQAYKHREMAG